MSDVQENKPPEYMIKREWRSSFRLNINHLIMDRVLGGLLHPSIPIPPAPATLRIADVGTGTAAWPLAAATTFPHSHIDGFDISPTQFSPLYSIRNVRLVVHDCWQPFPAEYIGKYDIVHTRFWLTLVNNPDAPKLLERLMTLVKPGGYVQWFEPKVSGIRTWKPEGAEEGEGKVMDGFCELYRKPRVDTSYEWVDGLPELFREGGLESVVGETFWLGDEYRQMWMHSHLAGLEDSVLDERHGLKRVEQVREFSRGLQEEMKRGVAFHAPFICVTGRKNV